LASATPVTADTAIIRERQPVTERNRVDQQVAVDEPYADVHADTLPQRPTLVGVEGGLEPSALEELISRMADRAEANQPSDRPSMLSTDLQRTDRP